MSHDFISHVFGAPSPAQINTDLVSQSALQCLCHISSNTCFLYSLLFFLSLSFSPHFLLFLSFVRSFVHSFVLSFSFSLFLSVSFSLSLSLYFFLSFFLSFVHSFTHSLHLSSQPSLPALDNRLSFRVRGICSQLQETRQFQMKVYINVN